MTRLKRRGPGRPPVHDPIVIQALLGEREHTGETYAELANRSGIPASTLASRSRSSRLAVEPAKRSAFVEVVVANDAPLSEGIGAFEIVIESAGGPRRVLVPAGFDASELRRLVDALEDRC